MVSLFSPLPKKRKKYFLLQKCDAHTRRWIDIPAGGGRGALLSVVRVHTEVLPGCCGWQRPEEEPFLQRAATGTSGVLEFIVLLKGFGSEVELKG